MSNKSRLYTTKELNSTIGYVTTNIGRPLLRSSERAKCSLSWGNRRELRTIYNKVSLSTKDLDFLVAKSSDLASMTNFC